MSSHQWFNTSSVDEMTSSFNSDVAAAVNLLFPLKSVKFHPTDKPWMTSHVHIKRLILDRQKAYHYGKGAKWRELRNKLSEQINNRKKSFYAEKDKNLKNTDPRKWWNLVNRLSGKSSNTLTLTYEADG